MTKTVESQTDIYHIAAPKNGKIGQTIGIEVWAGAGVAGNYDLKGAIASVDQQTKTVNVRATTIATYKSGMCAPQVVLGYKRAIATFIPLSAGMYHVTVEGFTSAQSHPMSGTPPIPATPSAALDIEVTVQ